MKIQDRFNYLWEPCFTEATPTAMGEAHEGTGERRVVLVFHSTNGPSQTAFLSPGEAENLSTILATAAKQARSIKLNTLEAAPVEVVPFVGADPARFEAAVIAVLKEFVADIEAVGYKQTCEDWPDLSITYGKAKKVIAAVKTAADPEDTYTWDEPRTDLVLNTKTGAITAKPQAPKAS